MATKKWGHNEMGPYADSARGRYQGERIQQIARDEGWNGSTVDADGDDYDDAIDEAEDWLNDNVADNEHFFGESEQGDWGYWELDEEEDD